MILIVTLSSLLAVRLFRRLFMFRRRGRRGLLRSVPCSMSRVRPLIVLLKGIQKIGRVIGIVRPFSVKLACPSHNSST